MPRGVLATLGTRFCDGQWWKTHPSPFLRLSSDSLHPQHPQARRTGRQRRLQTPGGPRADRALLGLLLATVEGAILELLEQHGSLGYEQIAALLGEPADVVRSALTDLRESGLVEALSLGELQAHTTTAASYWRLTEKGRREVEGRRSE